jgi:hypothetical protein
MQQSSKHRLPQAAEEIMMQILQENEAKPTMDIKVILP